MVTTRAAAATAIAEKSFPRRDGPFVYLTEDFCLHITGKKFFNGPCRREGEDEEAWRKRRERALEEAKKVCRDHGYKYI